MHRGLWIGDNCIFYIILNHVKGMVSGGWDSQNDSGSGNLKSLESSLSYPVASEGPPGSASQVAPVVKWHNRQPPGITHQLMRQPPNALPMGLNLCTIRRRGLQCTLSNGTLRYSQGTDWQVSLQQTLFMMTNQPQARASLP